MVVGADRKRLEHIRFLINQAKDNKKELYHPEVGFNYRLSNLAASLGIAQLKRLNEFLEKKKKINRIYKQELSSVKSIKFQKEYSGAESSCWMNAITIENDKDPAQLAAKLKKKGVPSRRVFMPLTEFPPYQSLSPGQLDNCYQVYNKGLVLPSSTLNTEEAIHSVCKALKNVL